MQAIGHGFYYAYFVRELETKLIRRTIRLEAMINSKELFNVVANDGETTDRRLQIDI